MNIRTETIAKIFQSWLKRYSPPRMMADDAETQKAERDTLLRVLLHFAPQADYDSWTHRALDKLEYQMKTRAWPTKGELGSVCSNLRKDGAASGAIPASDWVLDPVKIAAKRMNAGDGVGDDWLYGVLCVRLMAAGEVSQDTLRKYRSSYFFSLKDSLGDEAAARSIEAEKLEKHKAAEEMDRDNRKFTAPTYHPKSFPKSSLDERGNEIAQGNAHTTGST